MLKIILFIFINFLIINSASSQQSFADLAEKTINSVVNISTLHKEDTNNFVALGSGFILDKDGYIVTNNHVIENAEIINVVLNNNKNFTAKIIGTDTISDIALIKIETEELLSPVILGNSDNIKIGDWILAIGNPFGLGSSVTAGIVSAKSRDIDSGSYNDFIQTDASINQGNSGGPMFNMDGEVIGMNTSIFSTTGNSMGIGFAIPSNIISWVVNQIKLYGEVNRGWIGIKMQPEDLESVYKNGSLIYKGILVLGITENSPAQRAGIVAGDIIVKINNETIDSPKSFSKIIYTAKKGDKITLLIWNNNVFSEKIIDVEFFKNENNDKKETNISDKKTDKNNYIKGIGTLFFDEETNNITIIDIEKNSDTERKGIKKGDIILKIDGYNIKDIDFIKDYINYTEKNSVDLSILHNKNINNVSINIYE